MRNLSDIRQAVEAFAQERDWDKFHSPKNLSMALAIEAGELMEHFQWLNETESYSLKPKELDAVIDEVADVQVYLVRLADKLNINIIQAVEKKMRKNAAKYPINHAYGSAKKYTEYTDNS